MNIDCDRMLTNLDNSIYDYNSHIQKILILQVIQQIFCEMLIGGRKIVNSDNIFLFSIYTMLNYYFMYIDTVHILFHHSNQCDKSLGF